MLVETVAKAPLSFNLILFNNPRIQFTVQVRMRRCRLRVIFLCGFQLLYALLRKILFSINL